MTSKLKQEMRDLKDRMIATRTWEDVEKFSHMADKHPRVARSLVDDHYRSIGQDPYRNPK